MNASTTGTIFEGLTTSIGTSLADNLPLVVGILAALIGLGILVRYVKRWIGKK